VSGALDRRYRAVVFDLFGTLVPAYPHHTVLAAMAAVLDVDPRHFIPAFAEDTRDRRETGQFNGLEDNVRAICAALGRVASPDQLRDAVRIRKDLTRTSLTPRERAVWTLSELRARTLRVGLISDCCEAVPAAWRVSPLAAYVDVAIFSCEVGVKKPSPTIYLRACAALGVPPDRCLYVGDGGSHELAGAAAVGMDAVLLAVPEEAVVDPYRPEVATWQGHTIRSLEAVVDLVE